MTLYFNQGGTAVAWTGEAIDGVVYPVNIEQLWTFAELSAVGLFKPFEADPVPEGKRIVGTSVEIVSGSPKTVYALEDIPEPTPSDFDLSDWQLRLGLIHFGYDLETIETTIRGVANTVQRQTLWTLWDRPTVIKWDDAGTKTLMTFIGVSEEQATPMWLYAKDLTM